MKLTYAIVLLAAAALTACGPSGRQEGVVKFKGATPNTSLQKAKGDNRELSTYCPACGRSVDPGTSPCPDKKGCNIQITWNGPYPCGACKGTGRCSACYWMEQPDGACYNCKGSGNRIYLGQSKECPNCKGKGKCLICDDKKGCDYCGGSGKLTYDLVKDRAKKAAKSSTDDEDSKPLPKAEEKKPEEKKPEEKKPEEKPSEEKK